MKKFHNFTSDLIAHGFFGREGGYSQGLFASLNCGLGSGDDRGTVIRNRQIVAEALGGGEADMITAYQIHSATALIVTERFAHDERPKVDGLVTNVPGLILGTLTADCGPLLFSDEKAGVIAASHAGWKGALSGITAATLVQMEALGAQRSDITVILGPMISQHAYEVGAEFRNHFLEASQENAAFFIPGLRSDHFMFDLPGYLINRLQEEGVETIINSGICTYRDAAGYYSYRRATHSHEPDYGRQIAAIALRA